MALCKECLGDDHSKALCLALDDIGWERRKRFLTTFVICFLAGFFALFHFIFTEHSATIIEIFNYYNGDMTIATVTHGQETARAGTAVMIRDWQNLLVEEPNSYEDTVIQLLRQKVLGMSPCDNETTKSVKLEGLPQTLSEAGKNILHTDTLYYLTLIAQGEGGLRRCSGGDYFEVDLYDKGELYYKSRLPTKDLKNGTYSLELIVPSQFAGDFVLKIQLLFSGWEGLLVPTILEAPDTSVVVWYQDIYMKVRSYSNLTDPAPALTKLERCTSEDLYRAAWKGRWTRNWGNPNCQPDELARFRCLPPEHFQCEEPWCFGSLGRLDSNGWVYSAHCSFKIFDAQEAWDCLKGRWVLFWGDSTAQDSLRNLLLFGLDCPIPFGFTLAGWEVNRGDDRVCLNPQKVGELFQSTMIFNGHHEVQANGEGMKSLSYKYNQDDILAHFNSSRWPDTIVMNSAIHDGLGQSSIEGFSNASDFAIQWWMNLYDSLPADRKPHLIWRMQVVPGIRLRQSVYNDQKMETYNHIFAEKLKRVRDRLPVTIIDAFDITFPWHYSFDYGDGAHYGRAPGTHYFPWHGVPHWYFVDLMVVHTYLNAMCPAKGVN